MTNFTAEKTPLLNFISDSLAAGGFSQNNSKIIAEHLVDAEMKGVPSHGVNRLGLYIGEAKKGIIDPCAVPELEQKTNNLISVDGAGGIGIVAMNKATEAGIKLARNSGIVAIAISNCGHTGRMGAYGEQAADAGFLGLSMGGGGRRLWGNVVPFGGKEPVMSTNPYTFSMPGLKNDPLVCDFAISNWPAGKVAVARANDDQLPPDIIIDKNGNPSTNPNDFYDGGALLPAAGPKGSGMGIIAELVGDAMLGKTLEYNWLFILLRVDSFRSMTEYEKAASNFVNEVRNSKPLDENGKVLLPGEKETTSSKHAETNGIQISQGVFDSIKAAANDVGISADDYF